MRIACFAEERHQQCEPDLDVEIVVAAERG
jgi:hypothetical protein